MSNPLRDAAPTEIKLARSPLHRVLVAATFPAILKISEEREIVGFQDKIRKMYPIFQREKQAGVEFSIDASGNMLPAQTVNNNVWRFMTADLAWRVTLSNEVVALETQTAYKNRDDFLHRLMEVLGIFVAEFDPANCTRLGIRYLNVLDASNLDSVRTFIRTGMRSLSDTEIGEGITSSAHSVTFTVPEGVLLSRWGLLPPNTVHDPNMMTPEGTRRWYLDMDCSTDGVTPFADGLILERSRLMTERVYSFFRWAMTDAFFQEMQHD